MRRVLALAVFCLLWGMLLLASCAKEYSCEGCVPQNEPPVANAGRDTIIIIPSNSALLDGTASFDPDYNIKYYEWKKIDGPSLHNIDDRAAAKTTAGQLAEGVYLFELTVTDAEGLFSKDTVQVSVVKQMPANHAPVANAGQDQEIELPVNGVTLNGSGSTDADNNIIKYEWIKLSGPSSLTITDANAVQTQVTNLEAGVYVFELTVTDAGGLQSKDTVEITVVPAVTTEIIFTGQALINTCYQDIPGACWINSDAPSYGFSINDSLNILPDSASIKSVWIKMDTSDVWEEAPANCFWAYNVDSYPQTKFTYCFTAGIFSVSSWFFSQESLVGRKVEVKIVF